MQLTAVLQLMQVPGLHGAGVRCVSPELPRFRPDSYYPALNSSLVDAEQTSSGFANSKPPYRQTTVG